MNRVIRIDDGAPGSSGPEHRLDAQPQKGRVRRRGRGLLWTVVGLQTLAGVLVLYLLLL